MEPEIKNAVITSAEIVIEDPELLTAWLRLDYGGSSQEFGGQALYLPKSFKYHSLQSYAGHFLYSVMEIAGVTKWADLPGKTIRVRADHGKVHAVGHIIKDVWFNPGKDLGGNDAP